MNELKKFAKRCNELISEETSWLHEFHAEWIDSNGHAKFKLRGRSRLATVEWNEDDGFTIRVAGPDVFYYERSRSVDTSEQAISRVSSMLCE